MPRSARVADRATPFWSRSDLRQGPAQVGPRSWGAEAGPVTGAAFFDLDRTLMAGSSGMEFARVAARRGVVSRRVVTRWAVDHLRYRIEGASDEKTFEALKIARESVTGVPEREIARMWPEVLAGILPRIHPEVLAEAHRHQDAGREVWIVSAAGSEMVESLAAVLGMSGGIGTRYEVGPGGAYTGEIEGPFVYGQGKVEAIEALVTGRGLDLVDSWSYSDSISDLPMLRAVGTAVAVNPDRELRAIATGEGWEILHLDRIGRRLAIGGTVVAAGLVGGLGSYVSSRRQARTRRLFP